MVIQTSNMLRVRLATWAPWKLSSGTEISDDQQILDQRDELPGSARTIRWKACGMLQEIEQSDGDPDLEHAAGRARHLGALEAGSGTEIQRHDGGILDQRDELPGERRDDPVEGLRQDHLAQGLPAAEAQRRARLPIAPSRSIESRPG